MGRFFAELKRRHVYRVGAAYAVVAWVLLQLVNNVAPLMRLPDWAGSFFLVALIVGFPVALIFAWTHELKSSEAGAGGAKTTGIDYVLAGAAIAVIGIFLYQQLAPPRGTGGVEQASLAPPAATQPGGISVAVLPFVNLSSDKEQEFFSDGMTEEITSALAKISGLNVVARTSAFQFKGENKDMRAIGQALGASHLIEGSVRKDGNKVRITAQLIRAGDGTHLWTESYDRELKGVFAVQEEIAEAIATALRVPLGLKQGDSLVRNRTDDVQSYDQYLRAKALVRARGIKPLGDAAALLEQVVARDPNYAPAWALLAEAYFLTANYSPAALSGSVDELRRIADASLPKAEAAARRAIQLDANLAEGYSSLAGVQHARGKALLADDLYKQALLLDSSNPDTLHLYSLLLAETGREKQALAMRLQLRVLEPFPPVFNWITATVLWLNGQNDAAMAMSKDQPQDALAFSRINFAAIYASVGRYGEAADSLQMIPAGTSPPEIVEAAARLLRTAPANAASPQTLPRLGMLGWVYLYVGSPDRVLEFYEGNVEAGYNFGDEAHLLWHPSYGPVRKTERFKAFARKAGYVEYWRARGWPELCHPTTGDDFVCE